MLNLALVSMSLVVLAVAVTGRQLVWLYGHALNHYLFSRFVDSEYTEYRELEPNLTTNNIGTQVLHALE